MLNLILTDHKIDKCYNFSYSVVLNSLFASTLDN